MMRSPIWGTGGFNPNEICASDLGLVPEEISFVDRSMTYCVCFVDMVNSTGITAELASDRQKIGKYYSIFINTMATLVRNYGAKIVKNAGDALMFYFPETSNCSNESAFKEAFHCFTTMIIARDIINIKLSSEDLPPVSYRISSDYGRVEIATSTSSKCEDLFGSTVNICAKMNSMAESNGIVIGGDLYQIIRSSSFTHKIHFKELQGGYSVGFSHKYPVYCVSTTDLFDKGSVNRINHLLRSKKTSIANGLQIRQQSQVLDPLSQQQRSSSNVLIVDDEPDTIFTFKSILSVEGYSVEAFTDSSEALKHFVQLPVPSSYYKLALLDIRMPGLNGLQLFYRIKTISPATKIIFCSALDSAEELISILPDITRDHLLKKPIRREDFINKINLLVHTKNVLSV